MTTSERCKVAGLKNLTWLAGKYGKTTQTLREWDKENNPLLDAAIHYAVYMKEQGKWE